MSWTDSYPILTDEMVQEFRDSKAGIPGHSNGYWRIEEVINRQEPEHLFSITIHDSGSAPSDLMTEVGVEEDVGQLIANLKLKSFIDFCPIVLKGMKGTALRIYLQKGLEVLVPNLVGAGFEVALMAAAHPPPSIARLWPLLALEEQLRSVTVTSPHNFITFPHDFERTIKTIEAGFGAWRSPVFRERSDSVYYPISTTQFGAAPKIAVRELLEAFMWHRAKGSLWRQFSPVDPSDTFLGDPDKPFDELDLAFAAVALYPRLASLGLLTFAPYGSAPPFFSLDIEYATWANPKSQLAFFHPGRCCGQSPNGHFL